MSRWFCAPRAATVGAAALTAVLVGCVATGGGATAAGASTPDRMRVASAKAASALPPAGARAVGATRYPVPAHAIVVSVAAGSDSNDGSLAHPLRTIKAALSRAAAGATIVLRGGSYHESVNVASSASVTIQAYPGEAVWFDGSSVVTRWTRAGGSWSTAWSGHFDHSASFTRGSDAGGFVNANSPMAAHPEQVFVDGVSLTQVADDTTPRAGQFSVDPSAGVLVLGSDPAGHAVRVSDLTQAFVVSGRVTLRGFGVRNYATALPQIATVYLGGHVGGDRLENLVITNNATQGLSVGTSNTVVTHVTSSSNGMTGIHSNRARNLVIQNCLITGNNREHFNDAPAAAGMKITSGDGIVVRDNVVTGNLAVNGIWTDVSTRHFNIAGNTVRADGARFGILTELSDSGIVADNVVSGARYGYTAFDTGNVKIFNNTFSDNTVWDVGLTQDARRNADPSTFASVPWTVRNIQVANNVFGASPTFQFYALDKATRTAASRMRIVVTGNLFRSGRSVMVGWGGGDNTTVSRFRTPQSLDSALQVSWHNVQTATVHADARMKAMTVPLPADIAAATGKPAGARLFGAS